MRSETTIDDIFGIKIPFKMFQWLSQHSKINSALELLSFHTGWNTYATRSYFPEVRSDIRFVEGIRREMCELEEFKDGRVLDIMRKYRKTYCPCTFFRYFNPTNRTTYLFLRMQIDDALGIIDTVYEL